MEYWQIDDPRRRSTPPSLRRMDWPRWCGRRRWTRRRGLARMSSTRTASRRCLSHRSRRCGCGLNGSRRRKRGAVHGHGHRAVAGYHPDDGGRQPTRRRVEERASSSSSTTATPSQMCCTGWPRALSRVTSRPTPRRSSPTPPRLRWRSPPSLVRPRPSKRRRAPPFRNLIGGAAFLFLAIFVCRKCCTTTRAPATATHPVGEAQSDADYQRLTAP